MINQGKVWGKTSHLFGKNNVSIHRIEVKGGGYCSKHRHNHKFNLFFVEKGELDIEVWKNDYDLIDVTSLRTGEETTIRPGEYHRFVNRTINPCIVYEIYWTELDEGDIDRESVGGKIDYEKI